MRKSCAWLLFPGCLGCALLLTAGATPAGATLTTLVNDTFDVGSLSGATRLDDVEDPLDADWWGMGAKMVVSDTTLSVVDDNVLGGINRGNAFKIDTGFVNESRVWVNFPGYDLANPLADNINLQSVGNYLQVTFDIRILNYSGDTKGGGFRFGMHSKDTMYSTTAPPNQDRPQGSSSYLKEVDGYAVGIATGDGVIEPDYDVRPFRETDNSQILSPAAADYDNYLPDTSVIGDYELGTNVYTIRFKLTRTNTGAMGAGMRTTLWIDDWSNPNDGGLVTPLVNTVDDGTDIRAGALAPYGFLSSFDSLVIGNRPGNASDTAGITAWLLDNVVIEADVTSAKIPGDANNDTHVDKFDAQALAAHWGQTGAGVTWAMGDFNDDHAVNAADASIMAANWGYGGESTSGVPEPSAIVSLIALALGLLVRRRR